MAEETEEIYAAAIARNMWRMTKRRALSVLDPKSEAAIKRAAFPGAPENKAQPLCAPDRPAVDEPGPAPTTLREFLRRLGEELERDDPRQSGS
jgi:hypothetical protein